MSDVSKTVKLKTIPIDKVVSLKISGQFHKRIVALYFNFINKFKNEKLEELFEAIREDKHDKLNNAEDIGNAYSIQTLLVLISDLEEAFEKGGHFQEQDFELPIEEAPKTSPNEPTEDSE